MINIIDSTSSHKVNENTSSTWIHHPRSDGISHIVDFNVTQNVEGVTTMHRGWWCLNTEEILCVWHPLLDNIVDRIFYMHQRGIANMETPANIIIPSKTLKQWTKRESLQVSFSQVLCIFIFSIIPLFN